MTVQSINEKREARALMPDVAWPTLAFGLVIVVLHWGVVALALSGGMPLWLAAVILGWTAYAHYTLVHESIHGNIVRRHPRRGLIHAAIGMYGAFVLSASWPLLARTHKAHHSHTNTPDDPDIFVKVGFARLTTQYVWRRSLLILVPAIVLRPLVRDRSFAKGYINAAEIMTVPEIRHHIIVDLLTKAGIWALVLGGFGWEVAALYIVPALVGGYLLTVLFQWLPHHPFEGTGRYDATRNSGIDRLNIPMLFQNWHLMHHLWPGVPFYNYRKLHRAIAPVLAERGARHEDGLWVGSAPVAPKRA